jgi:hypothetical protein
VGFPFNRLSGGRQAGGGGILSGAGKIYVRLFNPNPTKKKARSEPQERRGEDMNQTERAATSRCRTQQRACVGGVAGRPDPLQAGVDEWRQVHVIAVCCRAACRLEYVVESVVSKRRIQCFSRRRSYSWSKPRRVEPHIGARF